jgi:hypothetical protein
MPFPKTPITRVNIRNDHFFRKLDRAIKNLAQTAMKSKGAEIANWLKYKQSTEEKLLIMSTSNPKSEAGIPFEIEGETTYLNPDSAEGKALQRIDSLDPDDATQWITIIDDQDISSEEVKQLKREGWQVKTVSEVRGE